MGKNVFELIENGKVIKTTTIFIDDFIPLVSLDVDYSDSDALILGNKFDKTTSLSKYIDDKFKEQPLEAVKITNNTILKFDIKKGHSNSHDDKGDIWVQTRGVNIVKTDDIEIVEHKKLEDKIKIASKKYGESFLLKLSSKDIKDDAQIDFFGCTDDADYTVSDIHCGRVSINPPCQEKLKTETLSPLNLSDKQKAQFIAVCLSEEDHGRKELWDIAWVYFNLVQDKGVSKLKYSSAKGNLNYQLWMYYQGHGEEYKDNIYKYDKNKPKISDYIKNNGFFTSKILPRAELAIEYIKNSVFAKNPIQPYKGWYGQGYTGDMMILDGRNKGKWHKARQYYWLQTECEVEKKYVQILKINGRDSYKTTFIYDEDSIIDFFNENSWMLPPINEIKDIRHAL